jgi:hypothetical protein
MTALEMSTLEIIKKRMGKISSIEFASIEAEQTSLLATLKADDHDILLYEDSFAIGAIMYKYIKIENANLKSEMIEYEIMHRTGEVVDTEKITNKNLCITIEDKRLEISYSSRTRGFLDVFQVQSFFRSIAVIQKYYARFSGT